MPKTKLSKTSKIFFIIWLVCLVVASVFLLVVPNLPKKTLDGGTLAIAIPALTAIFLAIFSFALGCFFYCLNAQYEGKEKKPFWLLAFFKAVFFTAIFPIYFAIRTIKSLKGSKKKAKKILLLLVSVFILIPIFYQGYYVVVYRGFLRLSGLSYFMSSINGGNSMSPTLNLGDQYKLYPYKNIIYKINPSKAYQFKRGDIVSFSNEATREFIDLTNQDVHNFVKRIIALPGDKIKIQGGLVFLNGEPLDEVYTLEPNSTYAYELKVGEKIYGNFLPECEEIVIPDGKLFVLGDNRKNSNDSRSIGLVDFEDVVDYLPLIDQTTGYMEGSNLIQHNSSWRQAGESLDPGVIQKALSASCSSTNLYGSEAIDGLRAVIVQLKEIQPGWKDVTDDFYEKNKDDLDKINDLIETGISEAESLVEKMESGEWISDEQNSKVNKLLNAIQELSEKINSQENN